MREELNEWLGASLRVWERHLHLPLPEKLHRFANKNGKVPEAAVLVFTGWFAGILIALPALLIGKIFNIYIGALLFAPAAYAFMLLYDRGKGDGLLAQLIAGRLPDENIPFRLIVPILLVVLKMFLLVLIFCCGDALFLAVVFGGRLALEAWLAGEMPVQPSLVDSSDPGRKRFWIMVVVLLIISFAGTRLAAACAALVFALLWKRAGNETVEKGITFSGIRRYGALCEWLMLISGVLTI